ncbi:MAG TPA: hypothetical protein VE344_02930 [Methylomirabilota bacterium]|nr:hypothetical protein [Methylomirabilota bacterium]
MQIAIEIRFEFAKWRLARASLKNFIITGERDATEDEIAKPFIDAGCKISFSSIIYGKEGKIRELNGEVRWRGVAGDSRPPAFLKQLPEQYHFEKMEWRILGEA